MADSTVIKEAKWLRLLGFDTEIIPSKDRTKIYALSENRIFLTRNKKYSYRIKGKVFLVPEGPFIERVKSIFEKFSLHKQISLFTRCQSCNVPIAPVDKEKVKGQVPFYTYENQDNFFQCPECKKIFWDGSHRKFFIEQLRKKFKIIV